MLLVLTAASAAAQTVPTFKTGNELHRELQANKRVNERRPLEADYYQSGVSIGYIIGTIDAAVSLVKIRGGGFPSLCIPDTVSAGQLQDVAFLYLENNPDKRNQAAASLVIVAMMQKFACQ